MPVTYEQTYLTMDLAGELLSNNTTNRPLKQGAITRYVADILSNRWHYTAEPIKVDKNGHLLDGQNRCMAIIKASEEKGEPVSIPILLVRGLEPESQDVMDTGKTRTVADQLSRRGAKDYAISAAVARLCVTHDQGWLTTSDSPTHAQTIEFFDANSAAIQEMVGQCRTANFSAITPSTLAAGGFLIYRQSNDYDAVMQFTTGIKQGIGLEVGDPILAFRNRMQQAQNTKERVNNNTALLMLLRCWNAWRTGQKMTMFPIRKSGKVLSVTEIEK